MPLTVMIALCLCLMPVMADDVCMDIQSLTYEAAPRVATPGSDITYTLSILGSPDYHYTCEFYFDPGLDMNDISCAGCDIRPPMAENTVWVDMLAPASYDITGKISPGVHPGDRLLGLVTCLAYPEPNIFFECKNAVVMNTGIAEVVIGEKPYPSPEFPSPVLPLTITMGFLGVILLTRRIRET